MKCEICHKADAETAITRGEGDAEEELYVCNACAKAERQRRQKKSQRTRKVTGLPPGMSMSITEIRPVRDDDDDSSEEGGDEEPPPFIKDLIDAVTDLEKMAGASVEDESSEKKDGKRKASEKKATEFPCERVDPAYRVGSLLHLEGLHLIGELEATKRALRALDMELVGVDVDGVCDSAHVFSVYYACPVQRAKRVVGDILREERNARVRLFDEIPRVFGDSICRALAILKNCRLLSPGELFDLLSPLRLAAQERLLEGIAYKDIEKLMADCDLSGQEDDLELPEREKVDAERADELNRRFEDVVLNERAEGKIV